MTPAITTLVIVIVMAILFITEAVPLAITALGGAIVLGVIGIIPAKSVFLGFSNPVVLLFAGMYVIGAAVFYTGLAEKFGEYTVGLFGRSESSLMLGTMIIAATLSTVTSNAGTTAVLMPGVVGVCTAANISISRQLMPMAFAAGLGGIVTLVGSPPNIIAAGVLRNAGYQPFGFLEFAWIGIPLTVAGILYMMLIGQKFLPAIPNIMNADGMTKARTSPKNPRKMITAGLVLIGVIISMGSDMIRLPDEMAVFLGAIICILTGCLNEQQAYRSIDWSTLLLVASMMPLGNALEISGAGEMIANAVVNILGGDPSPLFITAVLFILSAGLTQFMSNTVSTVLLSPIGIFIAQSTGTSPHAVLMTVAVASSCAFATPIGTASNILVYGPGGYRFLDYVKVGSGLVLISFTVSILVIPFVWPFFSR